MFVRLLTVLTAFGLVATPPPLWAQAKKTAAPTILVRIQPIEELLANAKFLAQLGQMDNQFAMVDNMVRSFVGAEGKSGIDSARPIGLYGTLSPQVIDSSAVLLAPIANEKKLLDLLESFDIKADKGKDDIYSLNVPNIPLPIYFRFAEQYVYITARDKGALDTKKLLVDPAKALTGDASEAFTLTVRVDQIPANLKQLFLSQFHDQLEKEEDKKRPDESDAQHALKVQTMKALGQWITDVVNDGNELSLRYLVDRNKKTLGGTFRMDGKGKTPIAESIQAMVQRKSVIASALGSDNALKMLFNGTLPAGVRKTFEPVVEEGFRKSLAKAKTEKEKAQALKVYKALAPSFRAGELDLGVSIRGPKNGLYTVVAGLKVTEGQSIDKVVRDLIQESSVAEREKVTLDKEKVGDVAIHQVNVEGELDAKARRTFGNNPLFFAFREDAVLVALGEDGLAALKNAIAASAQAAPVVAVEMAAARFAVFMESNNNKNAVNVAKKVFSGKNKGHDKLRFTVEGGEALTLHFAADTALVNFMRQIGDGARNSLDAPAKKKKKANPTDD